MKKYFVLLFFCSLSFIAYTQQRLMCATDAGTIDMEEYYLNSTFEKLLPLSSYAGVDWMPIQLNIVVNNDGTGGPALANVQWELDTLNARFARLNIRFFQCAPIKYIRSTALAISNYSSGLTHSCASTTAEYTLANANNKANAINIYFIDSSNTSHAHFPSDRTNSCADWIILNNAQLRWYGVLAHEMGHYFNLLHTFQGAKSLSSIEHRERDSTQACYNCKTKGDLLCDTQADPDTLSSGSWGAACNFTMNVKDTNCSLVSFVPWSENIMSYSGTCSHFFTNGQALRMKASINNSDRNYLQCSELAACQDIQILSGAANAQTKYWQVDNYISSTQSISNSPLVVYDARNSVTLSPGFRATASGSNCFNAFIDGCYGNNIFGTLRNARPSDTTAPAFFFFPGKFDFLSGFYSTLRQGKYFLTVTNARGVLIYKKAFRVFTKGESVTFYHQRLPQEQTIKIYDEEKHLIYTGKLQ